MKTNKSYQAIEILKLNADLLNECYDFFKKLKDKFPEMPIENELLEALSLSSIAQKIVIKGLQNAANDDIKFDIEILN